MSLKGTERYWQELDDIEETSLFWEVIELLRWTLWQVSLWK